MKPKSIVITTPSTLEAGARTQPVLPRWVLSGAPVTRTWDVLRSHDLTSDIVIWECSAGRFECQYTQDEAVIVVEGEDFITDETGQERRLGPGDLGFFPVGTSCTWRIPERVRKIAILRDVAASRIRAKSVEAASPDRGNPRRQAARRRTTSYR
jgi:uncharacterized cupin superfamily protein